MFESKSKFHWVKNLYQRWRYGAGCCDIFSLDYYLAKKIIKPLKEFRNTDRCSYPMDFKSPEEFDKVLDEMIFAFQFILDGEVWNSNEETFAEHTAKCAREQEGLKLFGEHFRSLWI